MILVDISNKKGSWLLSDHIFTLQWNLSLFAFIYNFWWEFNGKIEPISQWNNFFS
jgi:hypothetical protein